MEGEARRGTARKIPGHNLNAPENRNVSDRVSDRMDDAFAADHGMLGRGVAGGYVYGWFFKGGMACDDRAFWSL